MITEEDINKIKKELGEEKFKKFIYYLSKDKIIELKDLAKKKVKSKAIIPIRLYNTSTLKKLYNESNIKTETINLLNQCNITLKNIHKLIKEKSLVDANTLLRSCFENLTMAMVINFDEDVYKEFIDLNITDETRKKTKPQHVRNEFRKVLRLSDSGIVDDISNKQLKIMFDEFYEKLCLFTHSTLIVNAMVEIKKDKLDDIYAFAIKQNTYFLEIILYICLKYLNNSNKYIKFMYIFIGYYIMLSEINKENLIPENIEKLKKYLYFDLNKTYFNKNQKEVDMLKNEMVELKKMIEDNPIGIINVLTEIIK